MHNLNLLTKCGSWHGGSKIRVRLEKKCRVELCVTDTCCLTASGDNRLLGDGLAKMISSRGDTRVAVSRQL